MRALLEVTHPAHVHFFRHVIAELRTAGHEVAVTARDKDMALALLQELGIEHTVLSRTGVGLTGLLGEMLLRDARLVRFGRRFRPDVLSGVSGLYAAHAGLVLRKPVVVWDDTEHARLSHALTNPCATAIYTPDCFRADVGAKQRRYAGCHELAYLHPDRFTPDREVVRSVGIDPDERYVVVRFVGWGAAHDAGHRGIGSRERREFVEAIRASATPWITSEAPLSADLEPYRLRIPFSKVHDVLAFAAMYVGEGATMAAEAALLGTPAVYVNPLGAGLIDMVSEFGLCRQVTPSEAPAQVRRWLEEPDPTVWADRRARLLADKVDVTGFVVETLLRHAAEGR